MINYNLISHVLGAIEKKRSNAEENEVAEHINELLERLTSTTKIKSQRHLVNQEPTLKTTRRRNGYNNRWGYANFIWNIIM